MLKKALMILLVLVVFFAFGLSYAVAEGILSTDSPVQEGAFFDWAQLATFGGVVAATVFIVQLIKLPIDKFSKWHIPTNYVVYIIALVLLILVQIFHPPAGGFKIESVFLALINAVVVSFAAMQTYKVTIEQPTANQHMQTLYVDEVVWKGEDQIIDDPADTPPEKDSN